MSEPKSPPDSLTATILEAVSTPGVRIAGIVWSGYGRPFLRVVWPAEDRDRLAKAISAAMAMHGEPAFTVAVVPDYPGTHGTPRRWSRITKFADTVGPQTRYRLADRVERVLRRLLVVRPRPRRHWWGVPISNR